MSERERWKDEEDKEKEGKKFYVLCVCGQLKSGTVFSVCIQYVTMFMLPTVINMFVTVST